MGRCSVIAEKVKVATMPRDDAKQVGVGGWSARRAASPHEVVADQLCQHHPTVLVRGLWCLRRVGRQEPHQGVPQESHQGGQGSTAVANGWMAPTQAHQILRR